MPSTDAPASHRRRSRDFRGSVLRAALLIGVLSLSPGCSLLHRQTKTAVAVAVGKPVAANRKPGAPVVPRRPGSGFDVNVEHRVGAVRMIGAGKRFVLIEFPTWAGLALPAGQELSCRPAGNPVGAPAAVLRVGKERRSQFVAADVISGQPTVGDDVFMGSEPAPTAQSSPAAAPPPGPGVDATPNSAAAALLRGSAIAPTLFPQGSGNE